MPSGNLFNLKPRPGARRLINYFKFPSTTTTSPLSFSPLSSVDSLNTPAPGSVKLERTDTNDTADTTSTSPYDELTGFKRIWWYFWNRQEADAEYAERRNRVRAPEPFKSHQAAPRVREPFPVEIPGPNKVEWVYPVNGTVLHIEEDTYHFWVDFYGQAQVAYAWAFWLCAALFLLSAGLVGWTNVGHLFGAKYDFDSAIYHPTWAVFVVLGLFGIVIFSTLNTLGLSPALLLPSRGSPVPAWTYLTSTRGFKFLVTVGTGLCTVILGVVGFLGKLQHINFQPASERSGSCYADTVKTATAPIEAAAADSDSDFDSDCPSTSTPTSSSESLSSSDEPARHPVDNWHWATAYAPEVRHGLLFPREERRLHPILKCATGLEHAEKILAAEPRHTPTRVEAIEHLLVVNTMERRGLKGALMRAKLAEKEEKKEKKKVQKVKGENKGALARALFWKK